MSIKTKVKQTAWLKHGAIASLSTLLLPIQVAQAERLEEVIVSATRREETTQKVPISINAFSAEMVEEARISDAQGLGAQLPGFSVNTLSKSRFNPALRGGSSSLVSAGAEQAVGLFIDDQYFGGAGDFEIDLFDIERIEVLRGPQGTLFGRNTTGGSINVVTKTPTVEPEGKFSVTLGNYDALETGGYISGPVAGNVFGLLAFSTRERDGTSYNRTTGHDIEDTNRSSFRGKLLWNASSKLDITAALGYSRADETAAARDAIYPNVPVTNTDLIALNFVPDNDPRVVQQFSDGAYKSKQWTGNLRADYDLGNAALLSITTYRNFDSEDENNSITGSPYPDLAFGEPRTAEAFSQEFRYVSDYESSFNWVGGLYGFYSDETRDVTNNYSWNAQTLGGLVQSLTFCPLQDPNDIAVTQACSDTYPQLFQTGNSFINERNKTTSYSLFADGTFELTDELTLLGGFRYTYDNKEFDSEIGGSPEFVFNPPSSGEIDPLTGLPVVGASTSAEENWSELTYRAGFQYTPIDSVMAYATMATGFRSGLFDGQNGPVGMGVPLDPETATSYEMGIKTRLLDDRMQFNVALFHVDYEDLQFYVTVDNSEAISTNAGEASVEGIELEFIASINDYWTFSANYSHQEGDSSNIPPEAGIAEGTPPQGTIPNSYMAALDFDYPLANGNTFSMHLDYSHKDKYGLEFNDVPQYESEVDSLINASITYTFASGFEISAWGQNLADEDIVIYGQDFSVVSYDALTIFALNPEVVTESSQPRYAPPRTYGVTFNYSF